LCNHNSLQSLLHYSEIIPGHKGLYSVSNNTNGIKIGLQLMANSQTPGELKNCKLENTSLLFAPLAQYLGSDKRRVLSPCVTIGSRSLGTGRLGPTTSGSLGYPASN